MSPAPEQNGGPAPAGARAKGTVRTTLAGPAHLGRWLERLARAGYVAKGVLYLLIGGTGLLVAVGLAEEARGSSGAVRLVGALPMGRVLIGALAIGLAGYSLLSLVAATRSPEGEPRGSRTFEGTLTRAADGLAGMVYAGLVALAIRLLADPLADTGAASELWAARLLRAPGGQYLLGVAGLVAIASAGFLGYKAAVLPLGEQLERRLISPSVFRIVVRLARLGIVARAVLFALCGWLLLRASWTGDPRRIGGLGDALDALDDAPAGSLAVGLVAAGCLAYGMYQFAKARYRRVQLVPPHLGGSSVRAASHAPSASS